MTRSIQEQTVQQWEDSFTARQHAATHDFRSDTITLPTGSMMTSIFESASSLGDDVFSEDEPTNSLEKYMEELTSTQKAVFMLSGTMANQIALRCLLQQPPYSVVCDRRSHVFDHEAGATSMFSNAHMIPVMPDMQKQAYLTLDEIEPNVVSDDGDVHGVPTRVISLECTLWGKVVPVAEVKRISEWAHSRGIKVHMDGARLWNSTYANSGGKSPSEASSNAVKLLKEYCSLVDTVSMCFSKSLGSPVGSILLAKDASTLAKARHFRKAMGGGMRQIGILTAPARVAVDHVYLSGEHLPRANALAQRIEQTWRGLGGKAQLGLDQETNMAWLDLKHAHIANDEFIRICNEEGVRVFAGRIVTHHQISDVGVEALEKALKRVMELGSTRSSDPNPNRKGGAYVANIPHEVSE